MANPIQITNWRITKFILVLFFALSWNLITLRGLLKSKFGLIDDHELIKFLGPDRDLKVSETFSLLFSSTEVGEWGESKRFRPTYYFLRLLQVAILEDSASGFFFYRILIMSLTATLVGVLAACLANSLGRKISIVSLLFWTLLASLLPVWSDVVTRLGPSELEQSAFYTLMIILIMLAVSRPENRMNWILISVLALISAGEKENMAIVFVVALLGMYYSKARLTSKKLLASVVILSGILVALIELGPMIAIHHGNATDIYGQNRGPTELLRVLLQGIVSPHIFICLFFSLVVVFAGRQGKLKIPREIAFLMLGLNLILISEFVFYAGNVRGNRYSMITQITLLIYLVIGTLLIRELSVLSNRIKQRSWVSEVVVAGLSLSILLTPAFASKNALTIYASADQSRKMSNNFQNKLESVLKIAKKENKVKFVVQSSWDYEPIYSTITYLSNYNQNLEFTLEVAVQPENTILGTMLLDKLKNMATDGNKDWKVSPLSNFSNQRFTCIFFDLVANSAPNCVSSQVITTN